MYFAYDNYFKERSLSRYNHCGYSIYNNQVTVRWYIDQSQELCVLMGKNLAFMYYRNLLVLCQKSLILYRMVGIVEYKVLTGN